MPAIVLATVKAGTTLEVLARVGEWYRVRLATDPLRTGYIQVRQVEGKVEVPSAQTPATQPRRAIARRQAPKRTYVSASGGYLPTSLDFDSTASFDVFLEKGTRTTTYTTQRTSVFDASVGREVHPNVFVGAAVSWADGSSDVAISQKIPHPFFFEQMRTLEATAANLPREEIGVHFQVSGLVPVSRRIHVVVGAGPSLFRLSQAFVTEVTYAEAYPFDTVEFRAATTTSQEKIGWGGNVQANVVLMLERRIGVDGLIRFSGASLRFDGADGTTFTAPAGGLQIGIGIRAEF